jgi:hypothetical protein
MINTEEKRRSAEALGAEMGPEADLPICGRDAATTTEVTLNDADAAWPNSTRMMLLS